MIRGKGIFGRGPEFYGSAGFAAWAASLGCDWAAVLGNVPAHKAEAASARAHGLELFLWSGPATWRPDAWRGTLALLEGRARNVGASGIIADPEDWQHHWRRAGDAEVAAMGRELGRVRRSGLKVGVTSFPSWGSTGALQILADTSGAVGMPQVYSPQAPAEMLRRANMFNAFASVSPVLAAWDGAGSAGRDRPPAWTRSAEQAGPYFDLFSGYPGIGFWTVGQNTTERNGFADAMRGASSGGPLGVLRGLLPNLDRNELAAALVAIAGIAAATLGADK